MRAAGMPALSRVLLSATLAACASAGAATAPSTAPSTATATPSPRTVPDTLAERVQACTACHGREGRATPFGYFPRIAGKPAGYLFEQLRHFRDGDRVNPLMSDLVRHLSDDYLREIAGHFAALDVPYPAPAADTLTAPERQRAEDLVRRGDPSRELPACAQCHGEAMTGVLPAIPGLLGLPQDYLVAQFGAWRNGTRHATAPDCMQRVARALSQDDLGLVARWLASRPVPADAHPAAALPAPLPVECGSVPR